MFGRLTENGNIRVLDDDGLPIDSLPDCCANIYPINNIDSGTLLSACYKNSAGIIITPDDAKKINLEIEDR